MRTPVRAPARVIAGGSVAPLTVGRGVLARAATLIPAALLGRLRAAVQADWQGPRFYPGALLVVALSALTVTAFFLNHPASESQADTHTYVNFAEAILSQGHFMDAERAPGYPALIAVVFAVAGEGHLAAVQGVQGVLFVLAALEAYALAFLILRRSGLAGALGLLSVGSNLLLLSFVKPLLSEAVTLFLVLMLALALTLLLHSLRPRDLWWVAGCALLLYLTRLEWVYLAAPLMGFVLLSAWLRDREERSGGSRRDRSGRAPGWEQEQREGASRFRLLLPHAVGATVLLYALVGGYILLNGAQTGYRGLTYIQNINLLGKVMQYHMQTEAPPPYAAQGVLVDGYVQRGITSPWLVVNDHPSLSGDYYALSGAYASAVVKAHPVEFALKTLPLLVTTLGPTYLRSQVASSGPLALPLTWAMGLFVLVHRSVVLFPVAVLLLVGLLVWRRTRGLVAVQAAAGVALLAAYDLAITALGTYGDYPRLHIPIEPLMLLVVWGMVLAGGYMAYLRWLRPRLSLYRRRWQARNGGQSRATRGSGTQR